MSIKKYDSQNTLEKVMIEAMSMVQFFSNVLSAFMMTTNNKSKTSDSG